MMAQGYRHVSKADKILVEAQDMIYPNVCIMVVVQASELEVSVERGGHDIRVAESSE
jgi:hypothetical protein